MPIPLLVGGLALGGMLLGSAKLKADAAHSAATAQGQATKLGIQSEQEMFNKALEINQPYRDAGYQSLEQLQGLADPQQRAQTLQDYYAGDEYSAMAQQVEEQQMRNAAQTGGVRGGQNQAALASIAPQLGQQYLSGLQNQYTGLANMGMGAASQGAQGAQNFGSNRSALLQQGGQAEAQNALTQGGIWGNTLEGLGGGIFGASGGVL